MRKTGLLTLAFLAACGDTAGTDTGTDSGGTTVTPDDSGNTPPSEATLLTVSAACPGGTAGASAEVGSRTSGITDGSPVLNIWETGSASGYNEEHIGAIASTGANLYWEEQAWTLNVTTNFPPAAGETLFACDYQWDKLDTSLTLAIRVYDIDGNFADCAAFGHKAADVPTQAGFPEVEPVSNASELASCAVFSAS